MIPLAVFTLLTVLFVAGVKFTEPPRQPPRDRRWYTRKPR